MCFMSMQVAIIAEIYKTCVLFLNMYSDLLSQLSINNELNYVHYYSFQKQRYTEWTADNVAVYFNIWGKSSQVYGDRALNFVLVSIDQVTIHGNKQQKYKNDINETFQINNTNLGTNCL